MLFAAMCNAVCLCNAFFSFLFGIDFYKSFLLSCFVLVYWHIVCLFQVWSYTMCSAFNLLVFPNSMLTPFFIWKEYVPSWEIAPKNNHYYHYYYYLKHLRAYNDITHYTNNLRHTAKMSKSWKQRSPSCIQSGIIEQAKYFLSAVKPSHYKQLMEKEDFYK